jgi:hypothetical protein
LIDSTLAGRIGATLPPDTPLVFIVNNPDSKLGFQTTQVANIARAAVPPDRAKDVYVYVGDASRFFARQPTVRPGRYGFNLLSRTTLGQIPEGPAAVFVESRFDGNPPDHLDPHLVAWSPTLASSVPGPRVLAPLPGEVAPSNAFAITGATLLALLLLWGVGLGWARWTFADDVTAIAAAPGFGVAILAVVGLTLERLGVPLDSRWGPVLVSVTAGGLGYLLVVLQGKPAVEPVTEVDEHPDE